VPINIPNDLPAVKILQDENIFVMQKERAEHQDVRPLRIAILNLMPEKIKTETQLLRLLSNSPIQVEVTLLHPETHISRNTASDHLEAFYKYFSEIRDQKFDGMIITGAPVEQFEFEAVDYWPELVEIMDWTTKNVFSTLHICWGAQAGLYHHFGIPKYSLPKKMFGVFPHQIAKQHTRLLRGFDDEFLIPQSRHTEVRRKDIEKVDDLEILAESKKSGIYLAASKDGRRIFATGHLEYDWHTLKDEYERDLAKDLPIEIPANYYPNDDPSKRPIVRWRGHAHLLFSNWLNYYVYQETPFDLKEIS